MTGQDRFLRLLLRIVGTASLLAVAGVVMPYAWMDAIHGWLGMGPLPSDAIVGYLARSTSAFYALLGGLLWVVSFDLQRHRLGLWYLGAAIIAFGDLLEGMPLFWSLCEGPIDMAVGIVILWLSHRACSSMPRRLCRGRENRGKLRFTHIFGEES
jgi:hypothetical protein